MPSENYMGYKCLWVVFIKTASDREERLCFKLPWLQDVESNMSYSHIRNTEATTVVFLQRVTAAEVLLYWSWALLAGDRMHSCAYCASVCGNWSDTTAKGRQLLPQTQCAHSVPKSFKYILRLFQNNHFYLERLTEPCRPIQRLDF